MFPDTPQPLVCDMLSPLHLDMQAELDSSCISYPFPNDLNNGYWRVHHQSDMNVPAPNFSGSRDLTLINPDDGTLKNMVSDKVNGSSSGSDANALVSENSQDIVY